MWMSTGSFDWQRVAVSIAVTAALAVGLAAAFLYHASTTPDVGPTAASLEDAFSAILGACLGLLIGSAAAALLIRRGSSLLAGVVAGFVAYWLAVVPYFFSWSSDDVGTSENVDFVLLVFVPAGLSAAAGAGVGRVIRRAVAAYKFRDNSGRGPGT
jgi:hypothetical protein